VFIPETVVYLFSFFSEIELDYREYLLMVPG